MIQFKNYDFNKHRCAHLNEHSINLLSDLSNSDTDDMQLQTKSVNNHADAQNMIIYAILNNHAFVNLGLPSGTLWAACNVGAKDDANPGKYFSWNNLRSNTDGKFEQLDIDGVNCPSPNETLSVNNDAARINMGGRWHMPTIEQLQELYRNTTKEYIEDSEQHRYGVLLTGPNGNSIFLPETGFMDDTGICDGWESMILSNTSGDDAGDVCYGYFDVNFEGVANDLNYGYGAPTRGVIDKKDWMPIKKYIDTDQIYENSNSNKSRSIQESKNKSSIEKKYVDAVIIANNKALILKRSWNVREFPGKWGFVGGVQKAGEDSKAAAIRKIFEETGIKLIRSEMHNMEFLRNEKSNNASVDYWVVQLDYVPEITLSKQHTKFAWHALNDHDYKLIFGKYYIMMDSFEVAGVGECLKVNALPNNYSINESYEEPYNQLSDRLEDIIYNESFEEYCWSVFANCHSNEDIRRKLIDGFCMEVCMFISHYNIPGIEYYILDDKGDAYHFLMKYENKWYDAYNYMGVDKLEDLEFVHMYMSKYTEKQLHTYLQLVSEESFDYKRAMELIREGCN